MKAYPFQHKNPTSGLTRVDEGMDLRDWFAGIALNALLIRNKDAETPIISAYKMADMMLKERESKDEQP
jgi:hypothetical protein